MAVSSLMSPRPIVTAAPHKLDPRRGRARRPETTGWGPNATGGGDDRGRHGTTGPKDPALARILARYADILAAESRPAPDWWERFGRALALAVADGAASLPHLAHRMAVTPRTLQRRLAEHGTTWQRELDSARNAHAAALKSAGIPMAAIAARLGYSDQRSLRRAMRRWEADGSAGPSGAYVMGKSKYVSG